MKTSTPTASPMRRKHSINRRLIIDDDLDDSNNLENEIQERRQEAINKSTDQKRKSVAAPLITGLTATQLAQHCKDCIKLATENKINVKNAFSFMLIDVMAVMSKKNDSEISKNFQVASCTLDASVKIYGYRVDAVHTDAVKMAGGVLAKEVDVDNAEGEGNEGAEDKDEVKKVKKKKRKKLTVVDPESLNAKSEAEILLDVVPRQNFLAMKTDGNDLLVKIPKYNDCGAMLIDSDFPCWPYDENKDKVPVFKNKEIFDPEELLGILREVDICNDKLCPDYSNFEFGKDYEEDSDNELSQNSNHFEFDINASVHDESMMQEEVEVEVNQQKRLNVPVGGYESGEEIVLPPEPLKKQTQKIAISDMKNRISINPQEYSLFDEKIFKAWAGPTYWKVRPVSKRQTEENKENEEVANNKVASKRTRKGKLKGLVGLFEVEEAVLVKHLAISKNTTFCKSTMLNWDAVNTTVPKDIKYKSKNLFSLYNIPRMVIEPKLEIDGDGDLLDDTDEKNDNEEELEYCSSLIIQDEGVPNENGAPEPEEQDQEPEMEMEMDAPSQIEIETWDQKNMVEMPAKVGKIAVSTFKRKKHVDIKNLKKCIWNILTESQEKVTKEIDFSELIRTYPNRMPSALAKSLSPPMIFNALLHLTNEKCLVLKQDKTNKADFAISQ